MFIDQTNDIPMNIWKMILTCLKHIELNNQKNKTSLKVINIDAEKMTVYHVIVFFTFNLLFVVM